MDFVDRYIAVWLTPEQFKTIFMIDLGPGPHGDILVGGQIVGAAPVGLWVELISVLGDAGELVPSLTKRGAIRLVRWECIIAAELWKDKPDLPAIRKIGFQPR